LLKQQLGVGKSRLSPPLLGVIIALCTRNLANPFQKATRREKIEKNGKGSQDKESKPMNDEYKESIMSDQIVNSTQLHCGILFDSATYKWFVTL
jgi:hypothetical protein